MVRAGPGNKPTWHVGAMVAITTTVPCAMTTGAGPGAILTGAMCKGRVSGCNPTVLV